MKLVKYSVYDIDSTRYNDAYIQGMDEYIWWKLMQLMQLKYGFSPFHPAGFSHSKSHVLNSSTQFTEYTPSKKAHLITVNAPV